MNLTQKIQTKYHHAGFTLVELLIVIGLVGLLSLIFSDILIQFLRGETRVKTINQVKNSGQVVLDKIAKDAFGASSIVCSGDPDSNTDSIIFKQQDTNFVTKYVRYRFFKPTASSNGRIAVDNPAVDENNPTQYCVDGISFNTNVNDIDTVNGISLESKDSSNVVFTVYHDPTQLNDRVLVEFYARPGIAAGTSFENTVGDRGVFFSTTIQLRTVLH